MRNFDVSNDQDFEKSWTQLLKSVFIRLETQIHHVICICLFAVFGALLLPFLYLGQVSADFYNAFLGILIQTLATLLGFGIGSYAIFVALGNRDYIIALMEFPSENNKGMPLYKVHLLTLAKFIIVLSISLLYFLVLSGFVLLQKESSLVESYFKWLYSLEIYYSYSSIIDLIPLILNIIIGAFSGFLMGSVVVETKCFIFNVYNLGLTHGVYWYIQKESSEDEEDGDLVSAKSNTN